MFWLVAFGASYSQDKPLPPIPHAQPVLPGTHVPPRPLSQNSDIMLRIDGPTTVSRKMCLRETFEIKYSVINKSKEPANGAIRAAFNGTSLTPVASAKVDKLASGKVATGAFKACCPSVGSFTVQMDYSDDPRSDHEKDGMRPRHASDSLNINCR